MFGVIGYFKISKTFVIVEVFYVEQRVIYKCIKLSNTKIIIAVLMIFLIVLHHTN
jgi:uncharacterized membrane protein